MNLRANVLYIICDELDYYEKNNKKLKNVLDILRNIVI